MLIKRGPYGHFAVEKTDSPDDIFEYASEMIARDPDGFFLPCSVDTNPQGTYISFDFSGLTAVDDFVPIKDKKTATLGNRNQSREDKLRKNLGLLLQSFADDLDILLNLSNIVLDGRYIFTDAAGEVLKICYLPIKAQNSVPELRSLGNDRLERLLNRPFFGGILTEDEKQELIYAVGNNDEKLYLECIDGILKEETESPRKIRISSEIIYAAAGLILCPLLYKAAGILPSVLSLSVTVLSLIRLFRSQRSDDRDRVEAKNKKASEERKEILFSSNETSGYSAPGFASLRLISTSQGIKDSYSILLDKVAIGSDVFLSDIVLEDPEVSPIHALIFRSGNGYYISSCTNSGKTFVENKRIPSGLKQEIKPGQKITIGSIEFRFESGL